MSRRLLVEADGGSRGNPGPAGYGALVLDAESGEVLAERAEAIGRATNNVAEYRGLLAGLQAAAEVDASAPVEVRMDSKLVVEQMSGRWKVKHPDLQPLARDAAGLVRRLGPVRFTWVPRERNRRADALANAAMDAAAGGVRSSPAASPAQPQSRPGWSAPQGTPTTTVLLRHGQTAYSLDKRFSGIGDPELTDVGRAQAAAAAKRLSRRTDLAAVVSSPLRRARATAQAVADLLGRPVAVEEDLRETDFGDWEGSTFAEVRARWPAELTAWLDDPDLAPPGGESFTATTVRVRAALRRLCTAYAGQTVLVVSHVTPIKTLARLALEAPPVALHRLHLDLAGISEIDWYADGPAVLRRLNDTAHLGG